ncbi:hypothetical protein ACIHFE_26105 [Streptomyces sp. NPDC052396]|uniref:hypothetical protein n=1 Tax=Streptomyces sp. NPDC052396 TaxID=3365689 RepID=UPI0037D4920F
MFTVPVSGCPLGAAGLSFTRNEAGTGTGMRHALDVYGPTPVAGGPEETVAE